MPVSRGGEAIYYPPRGASLSQYSPTVITMAPIAMFNALWLRDDGGAERFAQYGEAVTPVLKDIGADIIFPFLPVAEAMEGGFDPTIVGVVRYPSAQAFDDMWQSDWYAGVGRLRRDATSRAVLTRCAIEPVHAAPSVLRSGIVVLNMLWFNPGGRERYDEYLAAASPIVERVGGQFVTPRFVPDLAVDDDVVPDLIFFGNYPSKDALMALIGDPAYASAAAIRSDAVLRSMTTTLRVR